MNNQKKFIVSHAPFWHIGSGVPERNYNIIIAAVPAALIGISNFGIAALGVICLSIASAVLWDLGMNFISKRPVRVADGNSILIGFLFSLLLPATVPWWFVITGTFVAVVIGREIFGGVGSNPFNPAVLSFCILLISWSRFLDFDDMLKHMDFDFYPFYATAAMKGLGGAVADKYSTMDLFLGKQVGGIGATSGLAILIGGIYLIARGFIRWEIPVSFLAGVAITAMIFQAIDPGRFASPEMHILTGFTMIGAFFLATDDSSSPVNFTAMLLYGALGGLLTVMIRNIGIYRDGAIFAILLINIVSPLLDKIRPKALGKVS